MKGGRIVESGTYDEMMTRGGEFARLDKEYGGHREEEHDEEEHNDGDTVKVNIGDEDKATSEGDTDSTGIQTTGLITQDTMIDAVKLKAAQARNLAAGTGKLEGRLIVKEQRTTGSVSRKGVSS